MRTLLAWCVATVLAVSATQANAAWYEAKSKHFIIYANAPRSSCRHTQASSSGSIKRCAGSCTMRTRRWGTATGDRFALSTIDAVQRMVDKRAGNIENIAGFYEPRAEGCLAFVPLVVSKEATGGLDTNGFLPRIYPSPAAGEPRQALSRLAC